MTQPPMTPAAFGQIALQLLAQASIPGAQIDAAVAFRDIADALAEGRATIVPDLPNPTPQGA